MPLSLFPNSCVPCMMHHDLGITSIKLFDMRRTSDSAGELAAVSTGGQISSRLLSMRSANALLELPAVSPACLLAFGLSHQRPV
jgi:hypothetical protein